MTCSIDSKYEFAHGSILGLGESVTTDKIYEKQVGETNFDAFTTSYFGDLPNKLLKAILKSSGPKAEQLQTLIYLFAWLLITEHRCKADLTNLVSIDISIENEFCFYKKTENGVALIAIDTDGDLMFNFTGYKGEFVTNYYSFSNMDYEYIVYQFLSK